MEEKIIEAGEYKVLIRHEDDKLEVIIFDELGEEIDGIYISNDTEEGSDNINPNLN